MAVRPSTRNPTSIFSPPTTIHSYTVALKRAPSSTASSVCTEIASEMATPMQVIQCAPRRPICFPNMPAATAPTSGASGTASSMFCESCEAISVRPGRPKVLKRPKGHEVARAVPQGQRTK